MARGRKLRLALVASILAILFGFVTVGHARTHAGDKSAEAAACTLCQQTAALPDAPVHFEATLVAVGEVVLPASVLLAAPSVHAHGTRGPPAG